MLPRRTAALALSAFVTCVVPSAPAFAQDLDAAQEAAADEDEVDEEAEAVTRDLALLGELGDRTPAHVLRRLANSDDERVPAELASVFANEALSWRTRSLTLIAWARNVRTTEAFDDDDEGRTAAAEPLLEALRSWLDDTSSPLRRSAAIEAADELGEPGEALLVAVVEERGDTLDAVHALEVYAEGREYPDYTWFNDLYQRGGKKASKEERADYGPDGPLIRLREIAFRELAEDMRGEEVEDALESDSIAIRVHAERIQDARDDDDSDERAEEYFEDDDLHVDLRIWGASAIARFFDRERHFNAMFDHGCERGCDPELRIAISNEINRSMPQKVLDTVRKQVERGTPEVRLFAMDSLPQRVMVGRRRDDLGGGRRDDEDGEREESAFGDEKVLDALRGSLIDKDLRVAWRASQALVERNDTGAVPDLHKALRRTKDELLKGVFLWARAQLGDDRDDLAADAQELLASSEVVARRAALKTLGRIDPDGYEDVLRDALFQGPPTFKRAVLDVVRELSWGRGVTLLIEALDLEHEPTRRMALAGLWQMTGRDDGPRAADWEEWWSTQKGAFEVVERSVYDELVSDWGARLRGESVLTELFGARITRSQVAIALDLDGEALGLPATRRLVGEEPATSYLALLRQALLDFARETGPLVRARVLVGADVIEAPWEGLEPLGAEAATKLDDWLSTYAPIRTATKEELLLAAEADLEVETLVVVTTGDGKRVDLEEAEEMRRLFELRNSERDLVVHVIALGRHSRPYEWLAETSGGSYVFVP